MTIMTRTRPQRRTRTPGVTRPGIHGPRTAGTGTRGSASRAGGTQQGGVEACSVVDWPVSSRTVISLPAPKRSDPSRAPLAGSTSVRQPAVRLTRRGRVVVLLAATAVGFGGYALRGAPAASTDEVHHERTTTMVVRPGDTVWQIAERADPGADPRATVAEIERLNGLRDAGSILVGQPLVVPAA